MQSLPPPPPPPVRPKTVTASSTTAAAAYSGDLSSLLQRKLQQGLQETETIERTADGKLYKSSRSQGWDNKEEIGKQTAYVVDTKPDPKVCKVISGLFIGSQDAAMNIEGLKDAGVTHILNVATGIVNAYPDQFTYHNEEVYDVDESDMSAVFGPCFAFIDQGRKSGGVLVHCNAGISRSSTVVWAYLMTREHMRMEEAEQTLKAARPQIQPNRGFMIQLKALSETLKSN